MDHGANLTPPLDVDNRAIPGPWWLRVLARWAEGRTFCTLARFGGRLGGWVHDFVPIRRYTVVRRNLRDSYPGISSDDRNVIARGAYVSLGAGVFETLGVASLRAMTPAEATALVTFEHREHLDAALALGRGVVLVTAHLAGFDLIACASAHRLPALHVVTRHLHARGLDAWWQTTRASLGVHLHDPVGSMTALLAALRAGGCVAMMLDQRVYVRDGGVTVDFFGRGAETSLAPVVLAARAHCPLVPTRFVRDADGRNRVVFEAPIAPPPGRRDAWIALTQSLTARVEAWIRAAPEQWLWLHDRWRRSTVGNTVSIRTLRGRSARAINRLGR